MHKLEQIHQISFPWDPVCHHDMITAVSDIRKPKKLDTEGSIRAFLESIEHLPFEEFVNIFRVSRADKSAQTRRILMYIATNHYNDEWRFNAIQLLENNSWLSNSLKRELLRYEIDIEIRELLLEPGY